MQVRSLNVYPDRLEYDDNTYKLEKLQFIFYFAQESTMNFVTSRDMSFFVVGVNEKDQKGWRVTLTDNYQKSIIGNNLSVKEFEQLSLIYNFISNASFSARLSLYIGMIESDGFFPYDGYEFHSNGDILKKGKIVANLVQEIKNESISFGSGWKGLHSSSDNPYEFSISSGAPKIKFFGLETGSRVKLNTHLNHDIFVALLKYFISDGHYPTEQDIKR